MKKNDIYLAGAIILIALVWLLINRFNLKNGSFVLLYINNELKQTYALAEDGTYSVYDDDGSELQQFSINNGTVDVVSAVCPDKLCVHQLAISKADETIVCLPNKIVLKIESVSADGEADDNVDAVVY